MPDLGNPLQGMLRDITQHTKMYMSDMPVGQFGTHHSMTIEIPEGELTPFSVEDAWLKYALPSILELQQKAAGKAMSAVRLDETVTVGTGKVQDATDHVRITLAKDGERPVFKMSLDTYF